MKCIVTGAAGFIGSHLSERLLALGHEVVGIDCFTDYYARSFKEANLAQARRHPRYRFIADDLNRLDLTAVLSPGDWIFHQAAQAGVRASWGDSFRIYTELNINATQRLLEACKDLRPARFVYASSSSVYGNTDKFPEHEDDHPRPISPYGVTKLAAEHLCVLYHKAYGVPTVSLRYFTVYGPRQRPDMAFHKWCRAALADRELPVFGDGEQTRDFTFVDDIVDGVVAAATADCEGQVMNLGGGHRVTVNQVLAVLREINGRDLRLVDQGKQRGDVRHTAADIERAQRLLGYSPKVALTDGLRAEYEWLRGLKE
ncbi:MAG: NAD-dependent epimerase/dehydratase family protein [Myxococcales bacterium]|nr:NAD-dependent epimerase/dehydratase family protein [Myxococcales bacterium]